MQNEFVTLLAKHSLLQAYCFKHVCSLKEHKLLCSPFGDVRKISIISEEMLYRSVLP